MHAAILIWLYARRESTPLPVSPTQTDSRRGREGGGGRSQVNETFSLPENVNHRGVCPPLILTALHMLN
jgi:hypothetical protein